jgi:hypothetical protein
MKRMIYILLMALALSVIGSNANASTVVGSISCKQWLDRKNNPAVDDAYSIWLQGYLLGANAMYGEIVGRDFLRYADRTPVADWTDLYCQKYPDSMLYDSANALIKKLQKDSQL